jgi:hypothetical protein
LTPSSLAAKLCKNKKNIKEKFLPVLFILKENKKGVPCGQKSHKSEQIEQRDLKDLKRFEGFLANGDSRKTKQNKLKT